MIFETVKEQKMKAKIITLALLSMTFLTATISPVIAQMMNEQSAAEGSESGSGSGSGTGYSESSGQV